MIDPTEINGIVTDMGTFLPVTHFSVECTLTSELLIMCSMLSYITEDRVDTIYTRTDFVSIALGTLDIADNDALVAYSTEQIRRGLVGQGYSLAVGGS